MRRTEDALIREVTPADRDALIRHFEELPEVDRRMRFFGPADPADEVERLLALHDAVRLVAMVEPPDGERRCVGEAIAVPGAAHDDDHVAEFAVSVARDHRGGLGTELFERLRREAAARGIATLFGHVLTDNAPMLRVLQHHGGVTIEREDGDTVGLIVGTDAGAPAWPDDHTRRRILIESPYGQWAGEQRLRQAGHHVAVCSGPSQRTSDTPCPLLTGERCALVDGADAIVHLLPSDQREHRRIAHRLNDRYSHARVFMPATLHDAHPDILAERVADHLGDPPRS
ncbi:MAG: N-acetyltransferase family protein [Nitriliruptoraceae bacterium]